MIFAKPFLYIRHYAKRHVYALTHLLLIESFVIGISLFPYYR